MKKLLFALTLLLASVSKAEEPTLVFLMLDGVRADYVEYFVKQGRLPNIQRHFYQNGTVMKNAFTSMSLTVPSWSTIVTGMDIDRTGLIGNEMFNRDNKQLENYLDWRRDIVKRENSRHGRAYRWMHQFGHSTITDYFMSGDVISSDGLRLQESKETDQMFSTFYPLNNKFPTALLYESLDNLVQWEVAKLTSLHKALFRLAFDKRPFTALDRNAVEQGIEVIQSKEGPKKKYIGIYLPGIDHMAHNSHSQGVRTLIESDYHVGRIIQALQRSRYRKSTIVLVSDHGSLGGKEFEIDNFHNPLRGMNYGLTGTNLSYLLTGSFNLPDQDYSDFAMNTTTAFASEGDFSLRNFHEIQLHRYQCTNINKFRPTKKVRTEIVSDSQLPGHDTSAEIEGVKDYHEELVDNEERGTCKDYHETKPELIHAAVTSNQSLHLPKGYFDSQNWSEKNNWYDITHYGVGRDKNGNLQIRNIVKDLENLDLTSLALVSPNPRAYLENLKRVGTNPLDWIAVRISQQDFNSSPSARGEKLRSSDDVILVHKNDKSQALILTNNKSGQNAYRYVPIENFEQNIDGRVSFKLQSANGKDPFGYINNPFATTENVSTFLSVPRTERELMTAFVNTAYPTVVSGIAKMFNFRGRAKTLQARFSPDVVLGPRYGHWFTPSNEIFQSSHGMMQREAVRITFMMTGAGVKKGKVHADPVMSVDVLPTALTAVERALHKENKSAVSTWRQNIKKQPDWDGRPIQAVLE